VIYCALFSKVFECVTQFDAISSRVSWSRVLTQYLTTMYLNVHTIKCYDAGADDIVNEFSDCRLTI
jgi:hypothetical protein